MVFAQTLSLHLAVQNRTTHPIIFEEALHTYFAISDISRIAISGLTGSTYIDKSDAARRKPQTAALVAITAETDRVYLDTPGRCAIETRRDRQPMTLSVRRRQTADNRDYRRVATISCSAGSGSI